MGGRCRAISTTKLPILSDNLKNRELSFAHAKERGVRTKSPYRSGGVKRAAHVASQGGPRERKPARF